jgi:hypothetical protein
MEVILNIKENNYCLLIDENDYFLIQNKKVGVLRTRLNNYAYCMIDGKLSLVHRLIMGLEKGDKKMVDHIDGNGLNNKRNNLRIATHSENGANKSSIPNTSSKYKGVYWEKRKNKWQSQITFNNRTKSLGRYNSEKDAALAYNKAALKQFGEFAKLNNIE